MMAIVEDDAECGFSHFAELSLDEHSSAVDEEDEALLDEVVSLEEVSPDVAEPSSPGGERGMRVGWMICLTRVGAPPIVSGQWMSFSSASESFFSRGKACTSSTARRVSMVDECCRTCREASLVKASGNEGWGEVDWVELRKRISRVDSQCMDFDVLISSAGTRSLCSMD